MTVFALTFAFNESFFLPRWISYYGKQIGRRNLFILDHGSTDGSTSNLADVNVIRVPRENCDDIARVQFASSLHAGLLNYYKAGFVTDADEFLVAHPGKYKSLSDFAARRPNCSLACVGLEVVHHRKTEHALDPTLNILMQRTHVMFNSWMCKRSYSTDPIRFGGGFHTSNKPVVFDQDLYLFHLKNFDFKHRLARQLVTREWDYAGDWGAHARRPLTAVTSFYERIDELIERGNVREDFDFSDDVKRCQERVVVNPSGEYDFNMPKGSDGSHIQIVPEHFRVLF